MVDVNILSSIMIALTGDILRLPWSQSNLVTVNSGMADDDHGDLRDGDVSVLS